MRAASSENVFSSSGKLGTGMPASLAPAPLAKSQASCTCRLNGNMSGNSLAARSASGSIFLASQYDSAFVRIDECGVRQWVDSEMDESETLSDMTLLVHRT